MRLSKIEKIAGVIATLSVGSAGLLGVYTFTGPVLSDPVVVNVSDAAMDVICPGAIGCYRPTLPDFVFISESASDATLPHETLHYEHPEWSECEVSNHLLETTGLRDNYQRNGVC
jgi:hypothetical protein